MIILKNTINTQTVYINKRKDVNLKDAVQYYTKSEADARFQPKGDYVTPEDVDSIVGSVVDEKIAPFQNEIDELETSKQEVFQVNQPLYFERDGEDLTLNVNLDNYATKEDAEYTAGDNITIENKVISWNAPDTQFVNTIFTDDQSLKYAIADFKGGYTVKEFPLATTEAAGLMSPEDKAKLDGGGSSIPTMIIDFDTSSILSGTYSDIVNALMIDAPVAIYLTASGTFRDQLYISSYIRYNKPGGLVDESLYVTFHQEVQGAHTDIEATILPNGNTTVRSYGIDYVEQSTYDNKMLEIDTAISDLQAQIGNIGTVLDNINGEVI